MTQNRFIQRNKKKLPRKDTLQVSEAVFQRCCVKKVSLNKKPVYLYIIEMYIS